jgi:hypothetical protein
LDSAQKIKEKNRKKICYKQNMNWQLMLLFKIRLHHTDYSLYCFCVCKWPMCFNDYNMKLKSVTVMEKKKKGARTGLRN